MQTTNRLFMLLGAGTLTLMGASCGSHGKYTEAHLSGAKIKMDGLKAATEYQMAHQAFLAGDLNKARKHVDHSISLNDTVVKCHVLKGRVFMEMNDLERASACFVQAQTLEPDNVDASYFRGVLAERVGRREEALTHYSRAAELDPSNAQYCIAAAEMMLDLGRAGEAKTYLEGQQDRFVNNAGVKQVLGNIAMLSGDTVAAEVLFSEARMLAPDDVIIRECLVRALMANHKFSEAEGVLVKLMSGMPQPRRDLQHLHARCLMHVDRPVEAREVYLSLTRDQQGQSDADAWYGLGQCAYVLRDTARLKMAAQRLVAIAPHQADGFVLRGLLNRSTGEMRAALTNFQQAVKISRNPETLVLLGMTQRDLGMTAQAQQSFEAALLLAPGDQTARTMVAGAPE
jgi:tetratricopeptide (TPR) repeat protein